MTAYEYSQLQNMLTDIQDRKPEYLSCKYQEGYKTAILKMKSMVHSFYNSHKTNDVEPVRHGHWIPIRKRLYACNDPVGEICTVGYICSECEHEEDYEAPYCLCGAKMDGKENK